jgi:hypothetical protein
MTAVHNVPDVNVGNIMANLAGFLMVTIFGRTLQVENESTNTWTNANSLLTTAQVSDAIAIPTTDDSGNVTSYAYTDGSIPGLDGSTNNYPEGSTDWYQWNLVAKMNAVVTSSDPQGAFDNFVTETETDPAYINVMSEAFGSTVLALCTQCWNSGDNSDSSAQMSTITSVNAEITNKAQQEESTSTNEMDKEKSQITSTTNQPSNEANLCTSIFQILSTIASALANGIA